MAGQFHFYGDSEVRRYEATQAAIALVGHGSIIEFIEQATRHETGAVRQANVDWFPLNAEDQLVILRDQTSGRIVAFLESERRLLFPVMPGPTT